MLNVAVLWLEDVCNPVMFTHVNMKNDFNKKLKVVSETVFIMTFTKKRMSAQRNSRCTDLQAPFVVISCFILKSLKGISSLYCEHFVENK